MPFRATFCSILIEKHKHLDVIRVICVLMTTPKIQNIIKKATPKDKTVIEDQFSSLFIKHKSDCVFAENYISIQSIKLLLTQNLSMQRLLDIINEHILLAKEAGKLLQALDSSVQSIEVNKDHTMFQ